MAATLAINSYWADKALYDDAEKRYYENLAKLQKSGSIAVPAATVEKPKKNNKSKKKNANNNNNNDDAVRETTPAVCPMPNGSEKKENKKNKNKNNKGGNTGVAATVGVGGGSLPKSSLASEVAKAREHIKTSLEIVGGLTGKPTQAAVENACRTGSCGATALADALKAVQGMVQSLEKRVAALEIKCASCPPAGAISGKPTQPAKATPAAKDDDDDVDLFGSESEEEDEGAKAAKEKLLADYNAKKSKKPVLIAKSSIILDVKPWDDETDMKELEANVRKIEMDGLLWGASKLVPLAYGIHKLQINCIVEDEKVSVDLLTENIEEISELVQSVDIAAFNKI